MRDYSQFKKWTAVISIFSFVSLLSISPPTNAQSSSEPLNIVTVAGITIPIGDGGLATSAQVNVPSDVTADAAGNIYIADLGDQRIRKVDATTGVITTLAGSDAGGFSGDGGPATAAMLNAPHGVAVDASGNVFFSDADNQRIRKIDTSGIITTIAGTGIQGYSGDGGPATSAQLSGAFDVAVDAPGNVYVADTANQRIRKIDTSGIITTVAGNGTAGFSGDGGPATSAKLNAPLGVAVDASGNIYIGDRNNNRVRKVDATTGIITTIAGTGVAGSSGDGGLATAATLNSPRGVAFYAGNLYISEFNGNRIRKVDTATGIITRVAGTGGAGSSGDGGPATSATLNAPHLISLDVAGNLYIPEFNGNRIRKVHTATGIITTFAGGGPLPPLGNGGPAILAVLQLPINAVFDASGNTYISEAGSGLVRRVDKTTGIITTFAGTVLGFSGDGGPATAAKLGPVFQIAFDAMGNLYIADNNNNRIRKVNTSGIITTVAGTGIAGFSGDGGPATAAKINSPRGLAVDASGNLYIGDSNNNRVRRVDATTGIITTVTGIGVGGFSGDGGPATAARINALRGIAVDALGNLYISDTGNNRIRKVDATTGIIKTIVGTGVAGFSGDGGPATAAKINDPRAIAVDASGNLYIPENGNNRLRKVDTAGIITTIAGNGFGGFTGDGGPATSSQLNTPRGAGVDSAGNPYVADTANNRVRRLNVAVALETDPTTLNIASKGKWITAYITFPAGTDPLAVNPDSVMLQAINPIDGRVRVSGTGDVLQMARASDSPIDVSGQTLMLKYNRATVESWVMPDTQFMLRTEGQFMPAAGFPIGRFFSGDTPQKTIAPPMSQPETVASSDTWDSMPDGTSSTDETEASTT